MSSTTVSEFANELQKSSETLLDELRSAGVLKKSPSDTITSADKQILLNHVQGLHGSPMIERKKISLVKKSTTEIKQADSTGKARTIQVEVRKKRTFVRKDEPSSTVLILDVPVIPDNIEVQSSIVDSEELIRREEQARRQAELIRRQEEELSERRRVRQEQEEVAKETLAKEAAKKEALANDLIQSKSELKEVVNKIKVSTKGLQLDISNANKKRDLDESKQADDLSARRKVAEKEAADIRLMMSAPTKKNTST